MSFLSLPTHPLLADDVANQTHPPRSLRSYLSTLSMTSTTPAANRAGGESAEVSIAEEPATDDHVSLITSRRGHIIGFDGRDPFHQQRHPVLRCIRPPPVTLAMGSKVKVRETRYELVRIHSVKKGQVCFVLGPHAPYARYVVLQVPEQYTKLPWHWRAWLRVRRLGREQEREDVGEVEGES